MDVYKTLSRFDDEHSRYLFIFQLVIHIKACNLPSFEAESRIFKSDTKQQPQLDFIRNSSSPQNLVYVLTDSNLAQQQNIECASSKPISITKLLSFFHLNALIELFSKSYLEPEFTFA